MGKHKKFLKSEKAKTKLKGAKLPKGLNVTKTDFKVKKIIIKEQLKETILEEGKRKQNVKELLTRLKHHNSSFRTTALRSLVEYFTLQQDEIHRDLGALIQGIAGVSLDIEKDIRRESFKLLGTLFSLVPFSSIEPFFQIISSYLRCAMTHIQQSIQEDSLLMLDVLLIHVPHLVAGNSNRIFSNFLDMISKFRTDAKPGRTLTTNLGNKITTIKWRTKILERLKDMLATMIKHKQSTMQSADGDIDKDKGQLKLFIPNVDMFFPVYRTNLNRSYDLTNVLVRSRDVTKDTESDRLKMYISQLIPLLFESWLEVRSFDRQEIRRGHILLSNDAASTLKTVLNILINLWKLAVICDKEENDDEVGEWFVKTCRDEFNDHMMNGFPYQQSDGSGVSKTKSKGQATDREVFESGGPHCLNQNLNLIYLYCILNVSEKRLNTEQATQFLRFLTDNIQSFKQCPVEWISPMPQTLCEVLYTNGAYFLEIDENNTKALLRTVLDCFRNEMFGRENKSKILTILCDIILKNELYTAYGSSEFDGWLNELPDMLCKPQVLQNVITTLSQLGKQKSQAFLQALRKSAFTIVENVSTIKIVGSDDTFNGQKSLMSMFYWIDDWSAKEKAELPDHVKKCISDEHAVNYFLFVLSQSFTK